MTEQRLDQIRQVILQYGPANCWTGTSGYMASLMRELVVEIERLQAAEKET